MYELRIKMYEQNTVDTIMCENIDAAGLALTGVETLHRLQLAPANSQFAKDEGKLIITSANGRPILKAEIVPLFEDL